MNLFNLYNEKYKVLWSEDGHKIAKVYDRDLFLKYYQLKPLMNRGCLEKKLLRILYWGYGNKRMVPYFKEAWLNWHEEDALYEHLSSFNYNTLHEHERLKLWILKFCNYAPPQFGQISFGSKFLMFFKPKFFVVLDSRIINVLADRFQWPSFMKMDPIPNFNISNELRKRKSIPFQDNTLELYMAWRQYCEDQAQHLSGQTLASDVERAYFANAESWGNNNGEE